MSKQNSKNIAIFALMGILFTALIAAVFYTNFNKTEVIYEQSDGGPPSPVPPIEITVPNEYKKTIEVKTFVNGDSSTIFTDVIIDVPKEVIDTIVTMRSLDVDGNVERLGNLDHTEKDTFAYIKFQGYAFLKFKADSITNWESIYRFKRTKSIEDTKYEKLGIVPQIRSVQFIDFTKTSVRLDIAYTHKIKKVECYLNGKIYKKFEPGHFEIEKPKEYLYTQYWGITGLKTGIDYDIMIFVTFLDGSVDTSETIKVRL